jgi:hypothetical protein
MKAKSYAEQALAGPPPCQHTSRDLAIYYGHQVLGRMLLRQAIWQELNSSSRRRPKPPVILPSVLSAQTCCLREKCFRPVKAMRHWHFLKTAVCFGNRGRNACTAVTTKVGTANRSARSAA